MRGAVARSLAFVLACSACATVYQAKFSRPESTENLDRDAPFLECHMRNGNVYVLEKWQVEGDSASQRVTGDGLLYDFDRKLVGNGRQSVAVADVALFETNRPEELTRGGFVALGVITGPSLALSAYCLTNPKACFGSCPTFYAFDGERESLQAEGFSASFARALEETDVDAMWTARVRPGPFEVRMANEAPETHAVDRVRLISVPRPPGGRVVREGDAYFPTTRMVAPVDCTGEAGDCLDATLATDFREYKSPAAADDLATSETLELDFPDTRGARGLVVVARNSLLNTFLFYQALAFAGRTAGDWLAYFETMGPVGLDRFRAFGSMLGGIHVAVLDRSGSWVEAGTYDEVGPIAREAQVVRLPTGLPDGPLRVRLTLTRGYWRIDQLALAELGDPVAPRVLEPREAVFGGVSRPDALARLRNPGEYLVTYPGDEWVLRFELPEGDQELFLESRGFYYEWMRESWLAEEDPAELLRLAVDPRGAMRRLAPVYKRVEDRMDDTFWRSRLATGRAR